MWIQSKKIYGTVVFFSALSDILIFKTLTKHQSNPPLDGAGNKFKSKLFPPDRIVKWLLFADKNLQRIRASTGYSQLYCQGKPICLWRFSAFLSFFILYLHVGRDIGGGEAGSHPVDFTLPAEHHSRGQPLKPKQLSREKPGHWHKYVGIGHWYEGIGNQIEQCRTKQHRQYLLSCPDKELELLSVQYFIFKVEMILSRKHQI